MGQNERKGTNLYLSNLKKIPLEQLIKFIFVQWFGIIIGKILAKLEKKLPIRF